METGELIEVSLKPGMWRIVSRCLAIALLSIGLGSPSQSESQVSIEWKRRMTESMRHRIAQKPSNPFSTEVHSASSTTRSQSPPESEDLPILSSLTHLLTQATTETLTFSREIRPTLDWPRSLWNLGEDEEWSWRKRFTWFQDRGHDEVYGTTTEATVTLPAADSIPSGTIDTETGETEE